MASTTSTPLTDSVDNYYQISDDDMDDCDDADDCLLEEVEGASSVGNGHTTRGPYERAWTTDATRALIHVRGPMEGSFTEGRQKRTALWLHCTRQLQKMGFRYSAAKVQKKWHNILITYNKNLCKKYNTGYVHWEFFEDMFKYLQGKKADCGYPRHNKSIHSHENSNNGNGTQQFEDTPQSTPLLSKAQSVQSKSRELDALEDDEEDDCAPLPELKRPKIELNENELPLELAFLQNAEATPAAASNFPQMTFPDQEDGAGDSTGWWKEYFEQKLQVEREKIRLQRDMHREMMQFNKASLAQQERQERSKIEAISNLASTLQKFVDIRSRKA